MSFASVLGPMLFSFAVAQGGTPSASANIAAVNLTKIFERYQMVRDLEQAFEENRKAVAAEAQQRREKVEMGRRAMADLKPGTSDFVQREEEQIKNEVEFQAWLEIQERRLKDRHKSWLQAIYQHVREVVAKIATERKIDMVLTYNDLQEEAPDSAAFKQQILLRSVLFANERVDLTENVIETLDSDYQRRGGAATLQLTAPPPPAAAPAGGAPPAPKKGG